MENNTKSLLELANAIGHVMSAVTFTRAQNETIIQNQILLNSRLMAIVDHFEIKLDTDWSLADSELLKESRDVIASNFQQYSDMMSERVRAGADSLKKP